MSEFTVSKFGSSPHLPREKEEGQGGQYIRRAPLVTYLSDPSLIVEKTTVKSVKCLMNIRLKQCRAKMMTFIRM